MLDRVTSIVRDGAFKSKAIDDDLDRWIIIAQELARENARSLKAPLGTAIRDLPAPAAGALTRTVTVVR